MTTKPSPIYRGGSSTRPVYFGDGASKIFALSAFALTKCIKQSNRETAGFVLYTQCASSTQIDNVVGVNRFPKTNRP